MQRQSFFSRLAALFRGIFGVWLRRSEAQNAEAVYQSAIDAQMQRYERLRDATARLAGLRRGVDRRLSGIAEDLTAVSPALASAVKAGRDDEALALIAREERLQSQSVHLQEEGVRIGQQIETTRVALIEMRDAIQRLHAERGEMLARKEYALARRSAQEALRQASGEAGDSAVDTVRSAIELLEDSVALEVEPGGHDVSPEALRRRALEERHRERLSALKSELRPRLLAGTAGNAD